jgi:hypothetical protein
MKPDIHNEAAAINKRRSKDQTILSTTAHFGVPDDKHQAAIKKPR